MEEYTSKRSQEILKGISETGVALSGIKIHSKQQTFIIGTG